MKIVAVVQARMGSSRLPGKVLAGILGKPALWHIVNRLQSCRTLDEIVIATSTNSADKAILDFARENNIPAYAGSENDLVDRIYRTARKFKADAIVRITADCPLADPAIVDKVTSFYLEGKSGYDYVSNIHPPTYPDGLDTEIFSSAALQRVRQEVTDPFWREWITMNFSKHPEKYRLANIENPTELSHLRWTVDYQEDLDLIREIYKCLYRPDRVFLMEDVLKLFEENPRLIEVNAGHIRNEAYSEALKSKEG
jgi:spore coat polysaccharide biosynthesis protein SpsF